DAVAYDPEEDRCLCHSVGAPQVQADAPSDQGGTRLVRPAPSGEPPALRPLATMSWQRPNIGSRVNREVHARFWERLGVKLLRATRQSFQHWTTQATRKGQRESRSASARLQRWAACLRAAAPMFDSPVVANP